MKTYANEGDTLKLTAPSGGVVSGTPVLIGRLLAVPVASAAETLSFAGVVEGVFVGLAKATSETWAEGDVLFWDNSAKKFTKTATGNMPAAYAVAVAGSSDTTGSVKLDPSLAPSGTVTALAGTMTGTVDGTIVDVSAIALSTSGGNTYSDAAVNTAVNTAITSLNVQLKELQTKLNAVIAVI